MIVQQAEARLEGKTLEAKTSNWKSTSKAQAIVHEGLSKVRGRDLEGRDVLGPPGRESWQEAGAAVISHLQEQHGFSLSPRSTVSIERGQWVRGLLLGAWVSKFVPWENGADLQHFSRALVLMWPQAIWHVPF